MLKIEVYASPAPTEVIEVFYYWSKGVIEDFLQRVSGEKYTDEKEFVRSKVLPIVFEKLGLRGKIKYVRFSRYLGCWCGCSPGFKIMLEEPVKIKLIYIYYDRNLSKVKIVKHG